MNQDSILTYSFIKEYKKFTYFKIYLSKIMLDIYLGYKITFSLIIGLLVLQCAFGLHEVEVYRLLGYEENGVTYGSKISSLNFMASHYTGIQKLSYKAVFIIIKEIYLERWL